VPAPTVYMPDCDECRRLRQGLLDAVRNHTMIAWEGKRLAGAGDETGLLELDVLRTLAVEVRQRARQAARDHRATHRIG
jgi:hypothetical protein